MKHEICTLVAKMFNELAIEERTNWTAEEVAPQASMLHGLAKRYFEQKGAMVDGICANAAFPGHR